jgi:3-hydroxybutyryl-CoA dehydratase
MAFTDNHLFFDDVAVGQEWLSPGRTVTEADIVNFAGLSGDYNPIHMDHEFAKTTPFRRPIAHGMLVIAIGSGLGTTNPPMRTVAFLALREWRFVEAVFPGDTIRVRTKVVSKELRGRGKRGEIVWQRTFVNQEGRVVQEGTSVTVVECRPKARNQPDRPAAAVQLEGHQTDGTGEV